MDENITGVMYCSECGDLLDNEYSSVEICRSCLEASMRDEDYSDMMDYMDELQHDSYEPDWDTVAEDEY